VILCSKVKIVKNPEKYADVWL